MCKVIEFNGYRGNKKIQKRKQVKTGIETNRKLSVQELVTEEWLKEYMQKGWSITKMFFHIVEQYGYINGRGGRKYVFEDIKRDAKYSEMYPEIENKRYKAPLWVKIEGEWYYIEMYHDSASQKAFKNKWIEVGNYNVKGCLITFVDLKMAELKRMWESHDLIGLVNKLNDYYYGSSFDVEDMSKEKYWVVFGSEETSRRCTYRLIEMELHRYAILEGTELETGSKHMVLMYEKNGAKEYEKYYKEQYGSVNLPLLYKEWNPMGENWRTCIGNHEKLYKRLVVTD